MASISKAGSNLDPKDISQQNIYNAARTGSSLRGGYREDEVLLSGTGTDILPDRSIEIEQEVANLISWLAEQQGLSREVALQKAVVTAAYIYDVTANQKGKLLVQRKDNSVGEIILK